MQAYRSGNKTVLIVFDEESELFSSQEVIFESGPFQFILKKQFPIIIEVSFFKCIFFVLFCQLVHWARG